MVLPAAALAESDVGDPTRNRCSRAVRRTAWDNPSQFIVRVMRSSEVFVQTGRRSLNIGAGGGPL